MKMEAVIAPQEMYKDMQKKKKLSKITSFFSSPSPPHHPHHSICHAFYAVPSP